MKIAKKQNIEIIQIKDKTELKEIPNFVKDYKKESCKSCGNKKN